MLRHLLLPLLFISAARGEVTFSTLLHEMTDRSVVTQWPKHAYQSLQASSYNRASVTPDDPKGWFANGDCGFFIRTEKNQGREESVLMEQLGPGVITRIWTPFFHWNFNNRTGSDIRIYIDGNPEPVIAENFINLVQGKGSVRTAPFSQYTVRSGVLYLPIAYSKSIKITQEGKPFFYIINYRAYEPGTKVEPFHPDLLTLHSGLIANSAKELLTPSPFTDGKTVPIETKLFAGQHEVIDLPRGPSAVRQLEFKLDAEKLPNALRSTVLEMTCDGEQTIWCPIGDFFGNMNSQDPAHRMWESETHEDGVMICRWIMPYRENAKISIHNLAKDPVSMELKTTTSDWKWTEDTMHFFTRWWTDEPWAPRPVRDMNFIDIHGKGVFVGDTLSVLNPHWSWWGEGDEKIFIDGDIERHFPSHFGTGTEDYYGWAGGEVPTRKDEFSTPFVANVRVGGKGQHTHGYNICRRSRSLDAIPFEKRFKFDMEAFNMIGSPDAFLQYSLVTHWYALPGAKHNKPPMPDWAAKPVPQTEDVQEFVRKKSLGHVHLIKDAIELENLMTVKLSPGLTGGKQTLERLRPLKWSGDAQFWARANAVGQTAEFTFQEQYQPKRVILYVTKSVDYGVLNLYVNDKLVLENWDGYSREVQGSQPVDLGIHQTDGNVIRLKVEIAGRNEASAGSFFGLDCAVLENSR